MLTVYNVGQGDSMLLRDLSISGCCFDSEPLLIDCGPQKANVHLKVPTQTIRVLVTHADSDHIGGLANVLSHRHVSKLYVPRYFDEIQRIERYLSKKIASTSSPLTALSASVTRVEVAENDKLCTHAVVFNPPKSPRIVFNSLSREIGEISAKTTRAALESIRRFELDLPEEQIIDYEPGVSELADSPRKTTQRAHRNKRAFVRGFFIYLANRLENAVVGSAEVKIDPNDAIDIGDSMDSNAIIANAFRLTSNQVSIVFRFNGADSWLFTGDADISVFNRIAPLHDLAVRYLKVPHHGSKHSTNLSTISAIKPSIAIVSHNNGPFGNPTDPHPHKATIALLNSHCSSVHYTNDVRKPGAPKIPLTSGTTPCKQLHFSQP